MKKHLYRVFALAVALLVLCAPVGAMAEAMPSELNATLALSNFRLNMGEEINAAVDITAQLDISANLNAGNIAGTLTALSGKNTAAKAGFVFDAASMNLTAGLEGVTDAVLLPMGEIMESLQSQITEALPGEDMGQVQELITAMQNLMEAAENTDPTVFANIVMTWAGEQISQPQQGVSLEVNGVTITADRYDFEFTAQELATLAAALVKAVQDDPELTAAVQAYIDVVIKMSGEETEFSLADLDVDALMAEMPEDEVFTLAGSLYVDNQAGNVVLDMTATAVEYDEATTVPFQFAVLDMDDQTYIGFATEQDDNWKGHVATSIDIYVPKDDAPVFQLNFTQNTTGDDNEENVSLAFTVDCTDGANVTLYGEVSSSFSYNDETYKSLNAFGVNYTGNTVSDNKGIAFPGTLTIYANNEGQEITVAVDTLVSLTNESNVAFNMPKNVINLTEADGDTMNALSEEYMNRLYQAAISLMGAPGMENLTSLFGFIQ